MLGTIDLAQQLDEASIEVFADEKRWHPALGFVAAMGVSLLAWLIGGGLVWLAWGRMNHVVGTVLAWVTALTHVS
jgi:hypothetical protein